MRFPRFRKAEREVEHVIEAVHRKVEDPFLGLKRPTEQVREIDRPEWKALVQREARMQATGTGTKGPLDQIGKHLQR